MLVTFLVAAWMSRPYLQSAFPYTHDGENHLARFMNYAAAFREGQIPPRFAPYLFSGFGFPVFHYNYPLANILAMPFIWLGFHPAVPFAVLVLGSAWLGVLAVYSLARGAFSRSASLFAVGMYATGSYWATATFFRGNIGEILWYGLLPITLWTWQHFHKQKWSWRWGVATVLVLVVGWLAHNVMAVLLMPLLALWTLSLAWSARKLKLWFLVWTASVLLVVWFWIPAVMELSLVALEGDDLVRETQQHLLGWGQVWSSPLRFGFSRPTVLDTLGFGLGGVSFAVAVLALSRACNAVARMWKPRKWRSGASHSVRSRLLLVVVGITALFFALTISSPAWSAVPSLSIIQFPWRLLFLVQFVVIALSAWVWEGLRGWKWILLVLLLLQIGMLSGLRPVDTRSAQREHYLHYPHTTGTRNENRPQTLRADTLGSWALGPQIATGEAEVAVTEWLGSRRSYTLEAKTDVIVQETTVFYPGWVTTLDGQAVEYDLDTVEPFGFITYHIPARPGEAYAVKTVFAARTPWRWVGEGISLVTLVLGAGFVMYCMYQEKRK
ncbi:hypothetical protein LRY60_03480 [Candidatus Woesebacteria bacterium]|nr:hypothetical protein [Candidatus Woesebacteria bacterium]